MTQWIETTKTLQNGEPVTRAIEIEPMDREIYLTDNSYAEVTDEVADLLANNISSISKVSEPDSPGSYFGDAGENVKVKLVAPDDTFQDLTVVGDASAGSVRTEEGPSEVRHASRFGGADGGEQIQAAINDLPPEGGKVIIGAEGPDSGGKWVWTSAISVPSNTHIEGAGMGATTMVQADGADAVGFHIQDNARNVTITDLEMDGNRRNQSLDSFENHVQLILCNSGGENISVERIYAHDAVNNFFNTELDESNRHKHISVKDCIVDNNYDPAVDDPSTEYRPGEDLIEFKTTDHATVSGCWLSGCWKEAVEIERSKYISVTNNIFEYVSYKDTAAAVYLETADENSQIISEGVTVSGNIFKNIQNYGTAVNGGRNVTIGDNIYENVVATSIRVGQNQVSPQDITIDGNVVDNSENETAFGVYVADANDVTVSDMTVRGGNVGINIFNSKNCTVENSRVRGTKAEGLLVNGGAGNHDVRGNNVREYSGGSDTTVDGLVVKDPDCTVTDNRVTYASAGGKAYNISGAGCVFEDNWTDAGGVTTAYRSGAFAADTALESNTPKFDAHRGQTDGDSDSSITVSFEKRYAERPSLSYGRVGGGIEGVSFSTDGSGNYDGVTLTIGTAGETVDVFVESAV